MNWKVYSLLVDWAQVIAAFAFGAGLSFGVAVFRWLLRTGRIEPAKPSVLIEKP